MFDDDPFNFVEFMRGETIIGSQQNGAEPKLGLIAGCFDMNVWWLLALITEKIEAESPDA
jgi:hypothetical protein